MASPETAVAWADRPLTGVDGFLAVFHADGGIVLSTRDQEAIAETAEWLSAVPGWEAEADQLAELRQFGEDAALDPDAIARLRSMLMEVGHRELAKTDPEALG